MEKMNIIILGGGESGIGAALLAKKEGLSVFVSDSGMLKKRYRDQLLNNDIPFEEMGHSQKIYRTQLVVKSPGIPDTIKLLDYYRENHIEIISEIEFAYRYTQSYIIAITGSNGKTTTSLLLYHILKNAGKDVVIAGNVGDSFAKAVATTPASIYVLELSSFQLDGITSFKPDIAIIMNITPDHLDRYNYQFEKYVASKMRITKNQNIKDHLIYCLDDETTTKAIKETKPAANLIGFSAHFAINAASYVKDNNLFINIKQEELIMTLEELALQGRHNVYNSMAAGVASRLIDIRKDSIKQCLSDFQSIPHRLEQVSIVHGVTYINDSKATNVNSAWYALESQNTPIIWIAGGVDKGNDYNKLDELVKQRVKALICLGTDNRKLVEAFINDVDVILNADSMTDAVKKAYQSAAPGDTVLLSPACASFDLFDNYEDRGNQFKAAVKTL